MKPPSKKAMIARRTRKGFNPEESAVLLDELLAQDMHPDALFLSLVYEEFATENGALALIEEQEGLRRG